MFNVDGIEIALKAGCRLHAFSSGGGLRVIRIEKGKSLKGYGEHPHVEEALVHVNEDYLAGGRPYGEKYGENGKYPEYLTGSSKSSTQLDAWVRQGSTFDAWYEGEEVVFQMRGLHQEETPEWVREAVQKTGEARWTSERGFSFHALPFRFANNEMGFSIETTHVPEGRDKLSDTMYRVTKTGRGPDFWYAMRAALNAPMVEDLSQAF